MMQKALVAVLFCLQFVSGAHGAGFTTISGDTMGTTYHVVLRESKGADLAGEIEELLDTVNQSMSVYIHDSEISRFNRFRKRDSDFLVSGNLYTLLKKAKRLHALTKGAWDGTVKPLVDLWGFGRIKRSRVPDREEIMSALKRVGFDRILLKTRRKIRKTDPGISLDLGSIAKGFGVDLVSEHLLRKGIKDFIVEIGGEVYASGTKDGSLPWSAGISMPDPAASPKEILVRVNLRDRALATSGDYRNFFTYGSKRYFHVIDPRTGYPPDCNIVSASVMAPDCAMADGLATAFLVMKPEESIGLAESLPGVEALLVRAEDGGRMTMIRSSGFMLKGNPVPQR